MDTTIGWLPTPHAICRVSLVIWSLTALVASEAQAQRWTAPPEVEISLNKTTYRQYEPVLLEVRLINNSNEPQEYGPIDEIATNLRVNIIGPEADTLHMYGYYAGSLGGWSPSPASAVQPGRSKSGVLHLSNYYPIGHKAGIYIIQIQYPILSRTKVNDHLYREEAMGYTTETATVRFREPQLPPAGQDALIAFGEAMRKVQNNQIIGEETIPPVLDRILSLPGAEYLTESALFLRAEYFSRIADADFIPHPRARQEAIRSYEELLQKSPQSVFAREAKDRIAGVRRAMERDANNRSPR